VAAGATDTVRIAFRDRGPGIDTEDVDRLFEPFFTTKSDGTGLGLAIANKIVAAHGGTIDFENLSEGGCEFVITLPTGRVEYPKTSDGAGTGRKSPNDVPAGAAL
jgi:two-component system sensor histidine kinase FlrB